MVTRALSRTTGSANVSAADGSGVRARQGRSALVADVAIFLGTAFFSLWGTINNLPSEWLPAPASLTVVTAGSLLLFLRRRFPATVLLLTSGIHVFEVSFLASIPAMYALGAYGRSHRWIWPVALLSLVLHPAWLRDGIPAPPVLAVNALLNLLPLVLGLYAASRRALLAGWIDRAERAEREHALIADRTRSDERTRIAREMHDSVAHQVSLVVLHAGALQTVAAKDAVKAETAAATIEKVGRNALDELRDMIGVLRARPDDQQAPKPMLDDLADLVESSQQAGLPVELTVAGNRQALPETVERAAYRVVQEALTNVHKHAGPVPTTVLVGHEPCLEVSVHNGVPGHDFQRSLPSGGQGLIGLTERVQLAGGTLDHGPAPDGGFRIAARFPQAE